MEAMEALKTRRSVRNFKKDPVPKEIVEEIVDAARLAATARNEQPWEFVVVTDEKVRKQLADITEYGKFIADSPVCIVVIAKDSKYYLEDGCAATQNLLVAARALGLGSCWVAGDKKPYADDICRLLGAPKGYKLVSSNAIGYAAEEPGMPSKRSVEDVIHWEKF